MSETPLKNLLPTFIKDLSEKGRSPATTLAYRADLEQFMAFSKEKGKSQQISIGQLPGEKEAAETQAKELSFVIYDVFKKTHGMLSPG